MGALTRLLSISVSSDGIVAPQWVQRDPIRMGCEQGREDDALIFTFVFFGFSLCSILSPHSAQTPPIHMECAQVEETFDIVLLTAGKLQFRR